MDKKYSSKDIILYVLVFLVFILYLAAFFFFISHQQLKTKLEVQDTHFQSLERDYLAGLEMDASLKKEIESLKMFMEILVMPEEESDVDKHKIGYWRFDETWGKEAVDSSESRNNGVSNGTAIIDGVIGKARSFSGLDKSKITIKENKVLSLSSLTFAGWVYLKSYPSDSATIFQLTGKEDETCFGWCTASYIRLAPGGIWALVRMNHWGNDGKVWGCDDSRCNIPINQWTFITATQDEKNPEAVNFFLNGEYIRTNSKAFYWGANGWNYPIQGLGGNIGSALSGHLDEIQLFDIALHQDGVRKLYLEGEKNLVVANRNATAALTYPTPVPELEPNWYRVGDEKYSGVSCTQYCQDKGGKCMESGCPTGPNTCRCHGGMCRVENWDWRTGGQEVCEENRDGQCGATIGQSPSIFNFHCCCSGI